MKLWKLLPFAAFFGVAPLAASQTNVDIAFKHYDIFPATIAEINTHIAKHSPFPADKKQYHGKTEWQLAWHLEWRVKQGICYLTTFQTQLNVVITMPRIPNHHEVPLWLRSHFENSYERLMRHEEGHLEIANNAARSVANELDDFRSFSNCEALEKSANETIERVIEQHKGYDRQYDDNYSLDIVFADKV